MAVGFRLWQTKIWIMKKYRCIKIVNTDGSVLVNTRAAKYYSDDFILKIENTISDFLKINGYSVDSIRISTNPYDNTLRFHVNFSTDVDNGGIIDTADIDELIDSIKNKLFNKYLFKNFQATSTYNCIFAISE